VGLAIVAGVIVLATAASVMRSTAFRQRLPSDRRAFQAWTADDGVRYAPPVLQPGAARDVVCGATTGYRQCLLVSRRGRVDGGFRVPPGTGLHRMRRSSCFGVARRDAACRPGRHR
jgi:hypothetical protein